MGSNGHGVHERALSFKRNAEMVFVLMTDTMGKDKMSMSDRDSRKGDGMGGFDAATCFGDSTSLPWKIR